MSQPGAFCLLCDGEAGSWQKRAPRPAPPSHPRGQAGVCRGLRGAPPGGNRGGLPPATAAPDSTFSPRRRRAEPGSEELPPPRPGPGPASAERSQPAPTATPPPPPPPPPAASVRTSSPTIQRARYPPGKLERRRRKKKGGEGCKSSCRGPSPSQIPLASRVPDVPSRGV